MDKKTALITGSYGGLGRCFVNIHAKTGGNLVLVGRNQEKLEEQADQVRSEYGVTVHTILADLSFPEAAQNIYDTCKENSWEIDYLINNAGFGGQGDFARERTMEQDMSMIAVNLETPTRLCKLFLPDFISRGSGKVLNVSSSAAVSPGPLQAVYYATKAYVTSWSNALWRELQGTGVTVTTLMPGAMKTGFADAAGLTDTKMFETAVEPFPVAQVGYDAMLEGKLNVFGGLLAWQAAVVKLAPLVPKKSMLNLVYDQQTPISAKK